MPITISTWDEDRAAYVDTAYYDANEVAERLHVSKRTVTRYTSERRRWPYTTIGGRPFLTEADIARVVELLHYDPDALPVHPPPPDQVEGVRRRRARQAQPPRLGRLLTDAEIEEL